MPGFGEILQKAVYLGVGIASYAGEKAGGTLSQLRTEAQKLADELVKRGEMTTEEARKFVEDMARQAQQQPMAASQGASKSKDETSTEPRRIEIVSDDEESEPAASGDQNVEDENLEQMRQQVQALQEELQRLKQD